MTVCIAAACDGGEKVICATDGLLSYGPVVGDTMLGKFAWRIAIKALQTLGQRFMQTGELQARQVVGFIFEQGIGRQQA